MLPFFMLLLTVTTAGSFLYSTPGIAFFSPGSFYFYVLGSYNYFQPPGDYYLEMGDGSADSFAPVFGFGYRLVNIRDRMFLDLEIDYSNPRYTFKQVGQTREANVYTIMMDFESRFTRRSNLTIFGGLGFSLNKLSDLQYAHGGGGKFVSVEDEHITALVMRIGIKIPLSRKINFRTEFRWSGQVYESYSYEWDYWSDDEWDNTDWDFLSSSISAGLELHL
jgi:hypothetical protein